MDCFYLDKTCNIQEQTVDNSSSTQVLVVNDIHVWAACHFYLSSANSNLQDTDISVNTKNQWYRVVLEANKTDVRENQLIELFEKTGFSVGKFKIKSVEQYMDPFGNIDNIFLTVGTDDAS